MSQKYKQQEKKMKKSISILIVLCIMLCTIVYTGCTVKYQGMSFQNSQGEIREVYIRNAGTQNWGKAIPITNNSIAHIDKSTFSRRVDIKAIDHRGNIFGASNVDISRNGDLVEKNNLFVKSQSAQYADEEWAFYMMYIIFFPIAVIIDIQEYWAAKDQRDTVAVRNE
jgi:hypothetical protein